MSTCPEKDLHSIYLDNELPAAYVAEYESHIHSCPTCKAQLDRLKTLRQAFAQDSRALSMTAADLNSGFERLQARLSYSKVTAKGRSFVVPFKSKPLFNSLATGAAAAVVVALVLPLRLGGVRAPEADAQEAIFQPVARPALVSPVNTTRTFATSFIPESSEGTAPQQALIALPVAYAEDEDGQPDIIPFDASYTQAHKAYAQAVAASRSSLASYDVFTPVYEHHADQRMFSLKLNSPLGNISLEIGNGN